MSKWQPIKTAPQDGTNVLVYCPHGLPDYFDVQRPSSMTSNIVVGAHVGRAYEDGGWWVCDVVFREEGYYDAVYINPVKIAPTHWMPLPEAPQ